MEICIYGKPINQYLQNCKLIYTTITKYFAHDTIQILNCAVVYFNMKKKEKLVEIIYLQLHGSLK